MAFYCVVVFVAVVIIVVVITSGISALETPTQIITFKAYIHEMNPASP